MYFGLLYVSPEVEDKLRRKHQGLTGDDVKEAIQWPAQVEWIWDEHEFYGWRVIAVGSVASGRELTCILKPLPPWEDDADTWEVMTAHWLE